MATITNRSAFIVSVPRHSKLERSFTYDAQPDITGYVKQLREQGFKPAIRQLEDQMQVRIRRVGHAEQYISFKSADLADEFVKKVESEQTQGLFIDYTAAANVTFAQLIERYITEVCPTLKGGGETAIYMLRALVEDSTGELLSRIEKRKQEMKEFGKTITKISANRLPMAELLCQVPGRPSVQEPRASR
jgi:enoyl reductase-like protein